MVDRAAVLQSVQRALVGEIDPCMKAISVDCTDKFLKLFVYVDDASSETIKEDFDAVVMTQIVSDFPDDFAKEWRIEFEFVQTKGRIDPSGVLVFARKGVEFVTKILPLHPKNKR